MERAREVRVVTGLTVFHIQHLHALGDDVIDLMAVHPAIAFVFLLTLTGDIFGTYVALASSLVIIHPDVDSLPGLRLYFQIRSDLGIIGQTTEQGIAFQGFPDGYIG